MSGQKAHYLIQIYIVVVVVGRTEMEFEKLIQLCMRKYNEEGFKYVCFDKREISVHTDVSESLCLSETPVGSFVFYAIVPFCKRLAFQVDSDLCLVFAGDIIKNSIIDFNDARLKCFVYKEDDTDLGYDPIPKYFWRGVASKLNVSGVSVESPAPAGCSMQSESVTLWNCNALDRIETATMQLMIS